MAQKTVSSHRVITIRVSGEDIVNYCYLVINSNCRQAILIDPAWDTASITGHLETSGCELVAILLTHHHRDHTNRAQEFGDRYSVPCYIHSLEQSHYPSSCTGFEPIEAGQLQIAGLAIQAIATPGHTAGSLSFLIGNDLFTGDTLYIEGCGQCAADGADAEQLYNSVRKLQQAANGRTRVFPGHRFRQMPGRTMREVESCNAYVQARNLTEFMMLMNRQNRSRPAVYL